VSTPVSWEEVTRCRADANPELLTFETDDVLARIEEQGDLFAPLLSVKQSLPGLG
jgi:bifunctional non-homologous end joining protein LigD